MRSTYIYDEKQKKMVPKDTFHQEERSNLTIMPDLPDFVSPIDQTVVHGRRGLREHNHRHQVTNTSDYTNEWAQKAKEREKFLTGARNEDRAQAIAQAFEKHRQR